MKTEFVASGYCRAMDQTRMVFCERDGDGWEADCQYPNCPYAPACPIAAEIKKESET